MGLDLLTFAFYCEQKMECGCDLMLTSLTELMQEVQYTRGAVPAMLILCV